ncbi:hypothetical protein EAO30_04645 [Klebsiella pneumoniae]|nr:hypothetical protein EAO30_04645 [Klebsiella pneumoniae]
MLFLFFMKRVVHFLLSPLFPAFSIRIPKIIKLAISGNSPKNEKIICLNDSPFFQLHKYVRIILQSIVKFFSLVLNHKRIVSMSNNGSSPLVLWYNQLGMNDVDRVGAKCLPW